MCIRDGPSLPLLALLDVEKEGWKQVCSNKAPRNAGLLLKTCINGLPYAACDVAGYIISP